MWECCKDDCQSQWERVNFDPQPTPNSWTDCHQIWKAWFRRRHLPLKVGLSPCRGFFFPYTRNIRPQPSNDYFTLFLGFSARLPTRPLDGFWRSIGHTTRFCARKCLLGVRTFKFNIIIFNLFFENFKIQWRPWEQFCNSLSCRDSGCIQDRVIIFGSKYDFRGRPI